MTTFLDICRFIAVIIMIIAVVLLGLLFALAIWACVMSLLALPILAVWWLLTLLV